MDLDQQPAPSACRWRVRPWRRNTEQSYSIPSAIQQCDRLVGVGVPLKVDARLGAALTFGNYLSVASASASRAPQDRPRETGRTRRNCGEDLFSYHPADYAILGGSWGLEEGGSVHHNAIVAGAGAVPVDAA